MTSTVDIVNRALLDLGQKTIASLDDPKKSARIAKQRYPGLRDAVLRAHPWNCAERRVELAAETTGPVFGPANAFVRLPDDLRVLKVGDQDDDTKWRVEGRRIVTDLGAPLPVRYIVRITDPNEFDTLLIEALASRIAWALAMPLVMKRTMAEQAKSDYQDKLTEARSIDGQESSSRKTKSNQWLESRRSGVGDPYGGEEPWV